ncbi:MAG: cell division protein FtsL [Gemmatimonadota bacterium]|nr:cell division protein FtsL [Gemmatimonadota bacterium]MDE2832064.1 cell division protein FtsL [Gemmatimonadota bacterium]MDE2955160.1 cell division protein FtsL [Gemmatimonadota bacterium]
MTSEPRPPWGIYRSGFLSVILLVSGLLIYMWGHVETLNQGREIDRLRAEKKNLLHQQERLLARTASLKQSSRIRDIAVRKLGMVFPSDPPKNLYLSR